MNKPDALRDYFGHSSFRPGQEQLIDALLAGRDVLGVMPTGGGKSICYQLPALLFPGLTVVISPLISLMKDQVMALSAAGIPAAYLNSSLNAAQIDRLYERLRTGQYKILYVAPERLSAERFCALSAELNISLVAVDEAHCISQWGQDFRPSYLKIGDYLAALPQRTPVAAFTATATAQVREDIIQRLGLQDPLTVVTGFDRPNLYFEVRSPANRRETLLSLLHARDGKSGIVYCATRKDVERLCERAKKEGLSATRYHAGLTEQERAENQEDFLYDRKRIMFATNAFGMGIDKSNVSYVIHNNMPKSIEAYYQEAGRAGRDGEQAECILLFKKADIATAKMLIANSGHEELTEEERTENERAELERLQSMIRYASAPQCLRGMLLDYFGQPHEERCGNCGNCKSTFQTTDITREAQMILSCVKRIRDKLGYSVGMTILTDTLHGAVGGRVEELRLHELSTYGLMRQCSNQQIRNMIDELKAQGYLKRNEYGALELDESAKTVLFLGKTVEMVLREDVKPLKRPKSAPATTQSDAALFEWLRALRTEIAAEEQVPPYIIFSNAALNDMAARCPRTMDEFMQVNGVGQVKAQRYGQRFLDKIADYQKTEKSLREGEGT